MAITATTTIGNLHDVLGRVNKVYLLTTPTLPENLTGNFDFQLPILDESLTFNMGEADVTRIKLIDKTNWTSFADKGDADIAFQVPSLSDKIAQVLGNPVGSAVENSATGMTYQGYSSTPKKLTGSLFYISEDGTMNVYLSNVEIFSTPVMGEDNKPAYFDCSVTPITDENGADFYIARTSTATA